MVKAPTKRKAPVVDLNETEKYTAKLAMARRSPAASSSAPSAAAGSQEGEPAVSARAPTAAEDPEAAGSGAAAGAAAENPEAVEEIGMTYKREGARCDHGRRPGKVKILSFLHQGCRCGDGG